MNSSVEDPRLRLLGSQTFGGVQEPADQVLRRLDETEVVVAVAADTDAAARVAVAAFVTMMARLVPGVVVDDPAGDGRLPNNWWLATSWADLLDKLTPVRPVCDVPATRQIRVGFGAAEPVCDIYVGGGDWNVVLADHPVVMETGTVHGLGLHAAGSLAVSQVLIKILADLGLPGVEVTGTVETNLVDHRLRLVDASDLPAANPAAGLEVTRTSFLGVGSVGTSAMALLATACSPVLNGSASTAALAAALEVTAVDKDVFDRDRNPYRYPALLGGETGKKSTGMVERLRQLGLTAEAHDTDVATWNSTKNEPGWHGVVISSVDTLSGRLDVADVLSRATLSAGVSGTELHVQWERFADGLACPFCDFVRAAPPLTQAGVYSQVTSIPIPRVLTLLQDGAVLAATDVDMAIAAGRVPVHRRDALVGAPLSDLMRQAYAEAEMRPQHGDARPDAAVGDSDVIAVASPQVSWFAGALIAAELVKHMLGLPTVDRRVDLDVAGLPAGVVRRPPADATGTCICHSGVRRRWYRTMYGNLPATEVRRAADPSDDRAEDPPVLSGASPILEGVSDALTDDPDDPGEVARVCTPSDVAVQYRQHHEWLRRVANRLFDGRRPDLADEAIGLLFAHLLELVEEQKLTDRGEGWRGYLRRAVLNRCVDLARGEKKVRERFPPGDPEEPNIIDHDPLGGSVAAEDLARRRQEKLDYAVENLTDRQVTILRHIINGKTNKQIGGELGITGQGVGDQLKTIIKKCHEVVTKDE